MEIDDDFFQISKDVDAYDFAAYACASNVDGDIFVEHDVDDMEGLDDDVVEGLYDSEDDRAITLVDGFDVTVPINQGKIVAILIAKPNKKTEDDEYYSDELDGSDSDESGDEERPSISVARAWWEKLIAKKIIEGDADKQYANLWRYVVELTRVNPGNIVNINVERSLSSIQPREVCTLYGFSVSPINGQEMWPVVQLDELLPPIYKNGHGRPMKVRIREYGEDDARRRRPGITYNCTKCDKFRHNDLSCKSLTQDPNALKRKRKPKSEQARAEPKQKNVKKNADM
ncbi:hypothetical protein KIW84_051710 [Lathyrus oleraceus]|uniref:Uncharacterized protein n=1 Tax=Pisum sativum TaxID=3888 RepID=A0A9D4WMU1_PEA|nr:hypothetical protein KIW84_051710 [Pisum sativum]